MGEQPLRPEGRRTQDVERHPDSLEGSHELLEAPGGDAFSSPDRLHSDRQRLSDCVGPAGPRALGVRLDLPHQVGWKPGRDPLQPVLTTWRFALAGGGEGMSIMTLLRRVNMSCKCHWLSPRSRKRRRLLERQGVCREGGHAPRAASH